jgi:hypothetical protein
MLQNAEDTRRSGLPEPVELRPAEIRRVAGGSPTLPLPPPARFGPDPVPW